MEVLTLKRNRDKTFPEREATMQMKIMGVSGETLMQFTHNTTLLCRNPDLLPRLMRGECRRELEVVVVIEPAAW